MRIPTHDDRDDGRESAAMTPMIDVVFLLLIFFVCASIGQVKELILPSDLAGGGIQSSRFDDDDDPQQMYWLYLRRDGDRTVFEINNSHCEDFETLANKLAGLAKWAADDPLILDIAPEVPTGDMIRVFDTCRQAGFESINFAADPNALGVPERSENG